MSQKKLNVDLVYKMLINLRNEKNRPTSDNSQISSINDITNNLVQAQLNKISDSEKSIWQNLTKY